MVLNATNQVQLLLAVIEKQRGERLSDYQFGDKLGIERSTWTHIRNGRRCIGITLLRAIVKTYPELIPDIINFLKDSRQEGENK